MKYTISLLILVIVPASAFAWTVEDDEKQHLEESEAWARGDPEPAKLVDETICDTAIGYQENIQFCERLYDQDPYPEEFYDTYKPVKCPNDEHIYPEGTTCDGKPDIDWDEVKDNSEVNRQEEKAMREADD